MMSSKTDNDTPPAEDAGTLGKQLLASSRLPDKIMGILLADEAEHAIWWLPNGESFAIEKDAFQEEILLKYFRGNKFKSMVRNLHRWGFKRMTCDIEAANKIVAFSHPDFVEAHPERVRQVQMIPKKEKQAKAVASNKRAAADDRCAPDEGDPTKRARMEAPATVTVLQAAASSFKPGVGSPPSLPQTGFTRLASSERDLLRLQMLREQQQRAGGFHHDADPWLRNAYESLLARRNATPVDSNTFGSSTNNILRSMANPYLQDSMTSSMLLHNLSTRQGNSLPGALPTSRFGSSMPGPDLPSISMANIPAHPRWDSSYLGGSSMNRTGSLMAGAQWAQEQRTVGSILSRFPVNRMPTSSSAAGPSVIGTPGKEVENPPS